MGAETGCANGSWRKALREGRAAAWPICLGYVAIGLAFGVIARKTGLQPLEVGLMSLLVYAGSSQFIAAAMIGDGAGLLPIVLTTFIVNLRHLLMSSSLSIHLELFKPEFWVTIPTLWVAFKTRSLAGTVLTGMGLFWLFPILFS